MRVGTSSLAAPRPSPLTRRGASGTSENVRRFGAYGTCVAALGGSRSRAESSTKRHGDVIFGQICREVIIIVCKPAGTFDRNFCLPSLDAFRTFAAQVPAGVFSLNSSIQNGSLVS